MLGKIGQLSLKLSIKVRNYLRALSLFSLFASVELGCMEGVCAMLRCLLLAGAWSRVFTVKALVLSFEMQQNVFTIAGLFC